MVLEKQHMDLNSNIRTKMNKTLYGLTSKGKAKVWKISVVDLENGTTAIDQEYGELGGKLQINRKTVKTGRNIGRSNETTPFQQATKEAESKYRKKLEQEGYSEDKDNLSIPKLPMLAQTFDKSKHRIKYPAYAQPKLNGVRCFAEKINGDTIRYTSRKGKVYTTLEHLTPHLLEMMEIDEIWDGEVYNHEMTFQEITAAVKKQRDSSLELELWVYDVADAEKDFKDRYARYSNAIINYNKSNNSKVEFVAAHDIAKEENVYSFHDVFVKAGFEGIIIRNKECGGYSFKHRSKNLQKYKEFIDEEFEIVGGYDGKGTTFEGMVTFECKAKNGEVFGVVPKGSHEYKRELWNRLDEIVAAKALLTVRYQELSDSGIPIFPIGIALRDYE